MAKESRLDVNLHLTKIPKFFDVVVVQFFKTIGALFGATGTQFGQMFRGVVGYAKGAELESFIPEWILKLTLYAIPHALWGETPAEQIEGSIILMGWGVFTSAFTGGATIVFVWFWSLFFWVGVLRYSDWGSSFWTNLTSFSFSRPGIGRDGSYKTRGRK